MGVIFDKLNFMKRLEDAGAFTRPQAEALSDAFHQAVSESVATKQDVVDLGVRTDAGFVAVRHEMAELGAKTGSGFAAARHETAELRTELRSSLAEVRSEAKAAHAENKVWTVSVGATIIAVLAAMKYFG